MNQAYLILYHWAVLLMKSNQFLVIIKIYSKKEIIKRLHFLSFKIREVMNYYKNWRYAQKYKKLKLISIYKLKKMHNYE